MAMEIGGWALASLGAGELLSGKGLLGGAMFGGGGSSSTTSDSTTTKQSWEDDWLEPIVQQYGENGVPIYWQNKNVAQLTPAEQEALNIMTSGQGINYGKNIAGKGYSIIGNSIAAEKALLSGDTRINKANFINDVKGIMSGSQTYIDNATQAATDKIFANYGNDSAQLAESTAGGAYTSGAANAHSALAVSADESVESTIAQIQAGALRGAIGLTANGMSAYGRAYGNAVKGGLGLGEKAFATGGSMINSGINSMMKGGLFEQYMNQVNEDNNWRNSMYSHNLPVISSLLGLDIAGGFANIDTTTNTHTESSSSSSSGGLF